jgi:hypothetical protein
MIRNSGFNKRGINAYDHIKKKVCLKYWRKGRNELFGVIEGQNEIL